MEELIEGGQNVAELTGGRHAQLAASQEGLSYVRNYKNLLPDTTEVPQFRR
jgi:hypothetical protein